MVTLLIVLFGASLVGGSGIILWALHCRKKHLASQLQKSARPAARIYPSYDPLMIHRPTSWLAVRGRNLYEVQRALGLHNAKPCTWNEALSGEAKLFIAPPVKGWILVMGSGLPDPVEDIDACYRCLVGLSRKLGHVQFFSSMRALGYHAWARLEGGRVVRAYAWAGQTLWNQGVKTRSELQLGLKCFCYLETYERPLFGQADVLAQNTEKVALLASRWSLDPATVDERVLEQACGVAGEPSHLY